MDAITQHHFHNIAYGKAKRLDNGDLATVNTRIVEIDGVETLIPTVWDGEIVEDATAIKFAKESGVEWPTRTGPNAVEELEAFDRDIHKAFTDQTSQEEAAGILIDTFGYPDAGTEMTVPGGKLILSNETFDSGSPVWDFIADKPVDSLLAPIVSERPELRPSPEYFANKELLKAQKDKDELYEYKAEQNQIEYERAFGGKEPSMVAENQYSLGGIATARKGITTEEGIDMANKKYQRDDKAADTNEDDVVSTREKEIADAIQKNEIVEMSHGGMMGGLMGGMMGYDEVSGNPIPIGSSPENVRDDIDAKLSTDEYVMPAHVVKWHGLKQIQMMQAEAEMGLMSMQMDGLIQSEDTPEVEEEMDDTEMDIDMEVATVMVDDKLDDSDEIEEISPRTSEMPLMKKNKYSFAV
tara:strand:- start:453 stop:1685 length:1233 start_codon:yes stop_codon:yes gene_type:complete